MISLLKNENKRKQPVSIEILVDYDAQTFRQGYGQFNAVKKLIESGIPVRSFNNNRISFILSDDEGYYLFIESRSLIPAEKETINAIRIDPVSQVRLKEFFFSSSTKTDFENELANAIIEESQLLQRPKELFSQQKAPVNEITSKSIKEVGQDLEKNPPLNPDYKRIVEFYSNKFQYVKLKFEGSRLQYRKIELPSSALPVTDVALKKRLETKLNLFDSGQEDEAFMELNQIKDVLGIIREKYLRKVKSREESLLDKNLKLDFEEELSGIREKIQGIQSGILMLLTNKINQTRENLQKELFTFLEENPKSLFPNHPNLWENNLEYIRSTAESVAKKTIFQIHWPEAHKLVEEFKLEVQYSDITIEDLKNEEFVHELIEAKLITNSDRKQLAVFSRGIEMF